MPDVLRSIAVESVVLLVLAAAVIGLALYRHLATQKQDFHLHVQSGEARSVGEQSVTATRIGALDKWGKVLTVVTVAYFLALMGWLLYQEFLKSTNQILTN